MTTVHNHQESSSSLHTDLQELAIERKSRQESENSNTQLKLLLQEAINNREESIKAQDSLKSEVIKLREAQKLSLSSQLSYISKIHDQVNNFSRVIDGKELVVESESELCLFDTEELDVEEIMEESLIGVKSVYALVKGVEKVRDERESRIPKRKGLIEGVAKESITAQDEVVLGSEMNAQEGKVNKFVVRDDSLENVSRESLQEEVILLQHFVDELREESSLLKAQVVAQEKELGQRKRQIEEFEEKERLTDKNVERLMIHITAMEKEITRWKGLAEEGAEVGRAVKQILVSQLATLRQELDEAKETIHDLEKSKESIISGAMAAKDTGDKSLRLADLRNSILKERLENLSHQLESVSQKDALNPKKKRYRCWPWIWPGLNFGGYEGEMQEQKSNVEELSEPLL